jgi:hypothetical protein
MMLTTPAMASEPCCAVAQHFDMVDRGNGNRIEIDRGRTAAYRIVVIDQTGGVIALAVDQYQHIVGRQAAQRQRSNRIVAVVDGWARKIKRRQQSIQGAGDIGSAAGVDIGRRQNIDGRQRLGHGSRGLTGARNNDLLQLLSVFGRGGRGAVGWRGGTVLRRQRGADEAHAKQRN